MGFGIFSPSYKFIHFAESLACYKLVWHQEIYGTGSLLLGFQGEYLLRNFEKRMSLNEAYVHDKQK